jgi:RNA polymerase sigma factor (sigma-70 family)
MMPVSRRKSRHPVPGRGYGQLTIDLVVRSGYHHAGRACPRYCRLRCLQATEIGVVRLSHVFLDRRNAKVSTLVHMGEKITSAKDSVTSITLEGLSRRYHAVLLRYFTRRGIGQQDAQDLAQEVFAKLSKGHPLENVLSSEAYLFTTAANVAYDFFRWRKVRTDNPPDGFYESVQRSENFSPERLVGGLQELACIIAALKEMPERMRNIFILARLENLPRSEIARRLGISKSLVEQQITLATACLSEKRRRIT